MSELSGIDPRRQAKAPITGIIVVGALLIVGLWAAALASIISARSTAMDHARIEGRNLAAAFADEVGHALGGVTAAMEVVARRMRAEPGRFDVHEWAREIPVLSFATIQAGIVRPDGWLISNTLDPDAKPVDLSDREHVRIHLDGLFKGIFIGKPIVSRTSQLTTIPVSRRVDSDEGRFLGVIVFLLAPASLTSLNTSIDLGSRGSLALIGIDRVVRARFTRTHPDGLAGVGESVAGGPGPAEIAPNGAGGFVSESVIDRVERLFSYRRAGDYPLVVWVGLELREILAAARQHTLMVSAIAGAGTLVLAGLIGFLIREIRRRAANEAALAVEHAKLDRVQRIAGIGSKEVDLTTGLVKWSPGACAIFGIDSDTVETTLEHSLSFVHEDDRARVMEAARQFRALDVATPPLEYRIVRPDGAVRTVYRENDIELDPAGRPLRRILTFNDITELKTTETRLRQTMDILDRAQRVSGVGSMERDIRTGQGTCSEEFCRILGVDAADFQPSLADVVRLIHPDDRAMVETEVEEADRAGVALLPLEYRIIRPDGEVRVVYRENEVKFGADGSPVSRIITFKDITEIKATESRLRQTMDSLARAQRLAHTGSDFRDLATDQAELSDESYRIFGVDPNEFVPTTDNFLNLVIPEDRPKILATWQEIAQGRTPAPFEFRIRRPSGDIRCIHRIMELIRDPNGVPVSMAGTIHDVTELREAEKRQKELEHQLLHSQKLEAVGTLAGGIAHELNNALVPILALGRMILDGLPPASELREDIEIMLEAAQRARGLVRSILAFSRKEEALKTEIDAVWLVRRTLSVLRATLPATLQITEELAPVPPVLADADALQQVLVNLVTNAAHAIGNAIGTITVVVEAAQPEQIPSHHTGREFIRIRIADTGCGMDAMTAGRIFEPFFTTKSVGEGTGLGLSVVHGIIADHDGQINVSSAPGKGTEFAIYLPAAAAAAPPLELVA